jgi:3-dehydroquinate synthase
MHKLTVKLAKRAYPVFIGVKLEKLGQSVKCYGFSKNTLVVADKNTARLYLKNLLMSLKSAGFNAASIVIPAGEKHKNIKTVESIFKAAVKARLDRKSVIIALGGGVVGDLAGFAAATYLRGVALVQVPTTLLAMVDSAVGGKTGFDLKEGKNLVGAFYQPRAVWIDTGTLKTLSAEHMANGMAEVIKYGVIKDKYFFGYLEKNISKLSEEMLSKIIYTSCRVKAKFVEKDEFEEKGVREILNFGHTFGHAVETLHGYSGILHGQAVALGMNFASSLAVKLKLIKPETKARIKNLIIKAGLGACALKKFPASKVISVMARDKKAREGKLRFVLPLAIGKVIIKSDVPEELIREVLK